MSGLGITSKATTYVDLQRDLSAADSGKFLRAGSSGTSIHTSSSAGGAIMNFLAKIGVPFAKEREDKLRQQGAAALEKMIDRDFGEGIGKKVMREMTDVSNRQQGGEGRDFSKGVKVSDLNLMFKVAMRFERQGEYEKSHPKLQQRSPVIELPILPESNTGINEGPSVPKKLTEFESTKINIPTMQNNKVEDIEDVIRQIEDLNIDEGKSIDVNNYDSSSNDKSIRKANEEFDEIRNNIMKSMNEDKIKNTNTDDVDDILNMIDEIKNSSNDKEKFHITESEVSDNLDIVNNFFDDKKKAVVKEVEENVNTIFDLLEEAQNDKSIDPKGLIDLYDFDVEVSKNNK